MNHEPTKEIRLWNDIPLNITARTGENRFSFAPPMKCDYGCIRGTWGQGLDRKSLDVYVASESPTVHKIIQIKPSGEIDEYKYILGAGDVDAAAKVFLDHVPRDLFGGVIPYSVKQLQGDVVRYSSVKKDASEMDKTNQLIAQLKGLIESDDAYGSPIEILNFNVKPNNDIEGKFKDEWNNRVFSFVVESNRFGYKPAINLTKSDSEESDRFDAFSQGYLFLEREDGKKRVGKSKCTGVSYSCGKSCIQLQKTCWIDDLGKKVKKLHGSDTSVSQARIDKLRVLAADLRKQPGGGNWSKFGTADLLEAKAKNLEEFNRKKAEVKMPDVKPVGKESKQRSVIKTVQNAYEMALSVGVDRFQPSSYPNDPSSTKVIAKRPTDKQVEELSKYGFDDGVWSLISPQNQRAKEQAEYEALSVKEKFALALKSTEMGAHISSEKLKIFDESGFDIGLLGYGHMKKKNGELESLIEKYKLSREPVDTNSDKTLENKTTTKIFKSKDGENVSVTYSPDGITIEQYSGSSKTESLKIPVDKARDIAKKIELSIEKGWSEGTEYFLKKLPNGDRDENSLVQIRINGKNDTDMRGTTPHVNFRLGKDVPMGQPNTIALRTAQQMFKPYLESPKSTP